MTRHIASVTYINGKSSLINRGSKHKVERKPQSYITDGHPHARY